MNNQFTFNPDEYLRKQKQIFEEVLESRLQKIVTSNDQEEVLTPEMTCKLLGKSRRTIEYWASSNIIQKRFLAHSPYFLRSEIISALKESNK